MKNKKSVPGMIKAFRARFAFRTLDINRICSSALEINVGSWRVMEKIGMRREGRFIKAMYIGGAFYNDLYYAVLREEYKFGSPAET